MKAFDKHFNNTGYCKQCEKLADELAAAKKWADLYESERDRMSTELDLLRERHRIVMDAVKEAMKNG